MEERIFDIGLGGFTLLQAPNSTSTQMMGYLLTAPTGELLVIDDGTAGDAPYLRTEIEKRGGHVSLWLLTHCHYDHFSALVEILNAPAGITVDRIAYRFPPREWIDAAEPWFAKDSAKIFEALEAHADRCLLLQEGMTLPFAGATVEVLNDPMDFQAFTEPSPNQGSSVNDTSLVFRVTFPNGKIALFLGDLGMRAGNLLAERYGEALRSDIVQMAHHGQNGAEENVYRLIRPTVCLWTAPLWLYHNDQGKGFDTAPFKTVTTRGWMEALGVQHHLVEGEGAAIVK